MIEENCKQTFFMFTPSALQHFAHSCFAAAAASARPLASTSRAKPQVFEQHNEAGSACISSARCHMTRRMCDTHSELRCDLI